MLQCQKGRLRSLNCAGLKISILQQPLVWMDGPANLRHFDRQLEGITGRDVIVLPEMFTTGFAMEAAQQSMPQDEVVARMHAKAQQTNALIAGSAALQTERGPVNRFLLVEPEEGPFYDKRHLFRMADEHHHYEAATNVWCLNGAAGVFCRWSVTTCASRSGRATATITTGAVCRQLACAALPALAVAAGGTRN